MTIRYVDSAATGSNNGTSWANAYTTLAGAAAVDAAGDIIYVKSTHSESTASAVTWDWAGTTASPTRIICVSDTGEPPTTMATGAVVAVTGANNLTLSSSADVVWMTTTWLAQGIIMAVFFVTILVLIIRKDVK